MLLFNVSKYSAMNPMDIELARTFLAVVTTGSFQGAADGLNVTQTAVSARIRSLEDELGRRVFVRNKAGARLTVAGQLFLRHPMRLFKFGRVRAGKWLCHLAGII